jgi:hypothetical protein
MHKRYAEYETADFAADESFKRWIKHRDKDDETDQHWTNFMLHHPDTFSG